MKSSYIYLILVPFLSKLLSQLDPLKIVLGGIQYEVDLALPFSWVLFYFAALSFTLGYIIYSFFAPSIIKENIDFSTFSNAKKNLKHLENYLKDLGIHDGYIKKLGLDVLQTKSPGGDNLAKMFLEKTKSVKELDEIIQRIEVYNCLYSNIRESNKENESLGNYNNDSGYVSFSFWEIYNYANKIFAPVSKFTSSILFAIGTILVVIVFSQNLIYVFQVLK